MRRALLAASLLVAVALPAGGAATPEALARAEARLAAASETLAAARRDSGAIPALVEAIGGFEAGLAELRAVVIDASAEERALALALASRREATMRLAVALQSAGRVPPPPPGLHPGGPLAAARATAMLAQATPALAAEAEALAGLLRSLETARALQQVGLSDLAAGLVALETARDALAQRMPAPDPGAPADPALAAALRGSDTLTALAAAVAPPDAGAEPAEVPPGTLLWPAPGRVVLGFNQPDAGGVRRPGILVGAPSLSLVAAPAAGTVRYAGPFLDFGYVVVLETSPGTLVVLAGLARLGTSTGAQVARGDLMGVLGGRNLAVEEYVMLPHAETGAGALETLYIEVRHGRGPVDPEPMFGGAGNEWEDER